MRSLIRKWLTALLGPIQDAAASHEPSQEADPSAARFDFQAASMRAVAANGFERWQLLNKNEAKVLYALETAARKAGKPGQRYRVMAQTSLGEVIRPAKGAPAEAQRAINSKRLDFAVIDSQGWIVCAVEYQGSGHYREDAIFRDAVKRKALRKAGVQMLEVHDPFDDAAKAALERLVLEEIARTITQAGAQARVPASR